MLLSFAAFKYILSNSFTCYYLKETQNQKLLLQIPFCNCSSVFPCVFSQFFCFHGAVRLSRHLGRETRKKATKLECVSYLTFSEEKYCVFFHYQECKNGHILSVLKVSVILQAEVSLLEHFSRALFSPLNCKRSADYGSCNRV